MGDVLPFHRNALPISLRGTPKIKRIAVDLSQLKDGRFEVTLRREAGHAPVCVGVFESHGRAMCAARQYSEHLRLPLVDLSAEVEF